MIERRPHWDDDLINAVRTAMRPRILTCADTIDTYDVIAAVEDWLGPVEEMVNDGERVQRVRKVLELGLDINVVDPRMGDWQNGYYRAMTDVRDALNEDIKYSAALDGDSDE